MRPAKSPSRQMRRHASAVRKPSKESLKSSGSSARPWRRIPAPLVVRSRTEQTCRAICPGISSRMRWCNHCLWSPRRSQRPAEVPVDCAPLIVLSLVFGWNAYCVCFFTPQDRAADGALGVNRAGASTIRKSTGSDNLSRPIRLISLQSAKSGTAEKTAWSIGLKLGQPSPIFAICRACLATGL